MTVSMEQLISRRTRKLSLFLSGPLMRHLLRGCLVGMGSFMLSAAHIRGLCLPLAAVGVGVLPPGLRSAAALGATLGYGAFFGFRGALPAVWASGILLLSAYPALSRRTFLPWVSGAWVALSALAFRAVGLEEGSMGTFAVQVGCAMGGSLLFTYCRRRKRTWLPLASVLVYALTCIHRAPGLLACAMAVSTLSVSNCLLWAAAVEAACPGPIPLTLVVGLAALARQIPMSRSLRRIAAPAMGALSAMLIAGRFDPWLAVCFGLGGLPGTMIPPALGKAPVKSTGAAQVKLESMAKILTKLQKGLLDIPQPHIDEPAFVDKLRVNACGSCSAREVCNREGEISEGLLHGDLSFRCRKTGRILRELQATQEQIGILRRSHSRQSEFRAALVQQYGYLSCLMEMLSDSLADTGPEPTPNFRIRICVRSRKKEHANGDKCVAFAGLGCRFYILLCDGMGTGIGASEEAGQTAELLRNMLQSGMPPQYALGVINAQLALRELAGAVTVDLAEVNLDSGTVSVYKWGAAPSWLLRRGHPTRIGTPNPPPGLDPEENGHTVSRLSLSRGEMLILLSDGVEISEENLDSAFACPPEPDKLAEKLLEFLPEGCDDATAAAIRLSPCDVA